MSLQRRWNRTDRSFWQLLLSNLTNDGGKARITKRDGLSYNVVSRPIVPIGKFFGKDGFDVLFLPRMPQMLQMPVSLP